MGDWWLLDDAEDAALPGVWMLGGVLMAVGALRALKVM